MYTQTSFLRFIERISSDVENQIEDTQKYLILVTDSYSNTCPSQKLNQNNTENREKYKYASSLKIQEMYFIFYPEHPKSVNDIANKRQI